ncbi:MAG TPA: ATP-binding protein [Bacteroidales bacterium]|nr:ATP-binding protein [Bacteroidales bacterium]
MYLNRRITQTLLRAINQFPVVMLTGPRQSGKTTLLKNELPSFRYVNLEDPELRLWADEQPLDFLHNHPWPLIIDEAQYAPVLFSYIQLLCDEKNLPGMFVLSGSQNFLVMEKITQSLAGRSAVLSLLPFSFDELPADYQKSDTNTLMLKGFYPCLYQHVTDTALFYRSYLNTYVERDVRQLANIGNLNDFIRFIKLCAGRSGNLLNISSLATEAGISYNTCKSWLSYLTTGFIIQLIQPHHLNFNKKIVKTPKIYFTDTGLLCHLLGIDRSETLGLHSMRGTLFENLVFTELIKDRCNKGKKTDVSFWRDNHGTEIDFLVDVDGKMQSLEVKSGMNFHTSYLTNSIRYRKYNPDLSKQFMVYDGAIERITQEVELINWRNISKKI